MLYLSLSTETRKCTYRGCEQICLKNITSDGSRPSTRYCFKHQNEDDNYRIDLIERKLFDLENNYDDMILNLKIRITSFYKYLQIVKDVKELVKLYKKQLKISCYNFYVKKCILYTEYLRFITSLNINKTNILSNGLKIESFTFNESIQLNYSSTRRRRPGTYFFNGHDQAKDILKIKQNIENEKFEKFKNFYNFYNLFSEDIENLIFYYFVNIEDDDYENDFYDLFYKKIRLNLELKKDIIMYLNKENNKIRFIKV